MSDNHIKPTPEELEKNIADSLEEIEKLDDAPTDDEDKVEDAPEDKVEDVPEDDEDTVIIELDKKDEDEDKVEDALEDKDEEKVEDKKPEDADYKKKFIESTREAQKLFNKNRRISDAVAEASDIEEPTEEEVKAEYPDYEDMTSAEKSLAADNVLNKKRFKIIADANREIKSHEDWVGKVNTFVEDPKTLIDNPELEGKQDDFKVFAIDPKRRDYDFSDLVLAFNGILAKTLPVKHKGSMFPTGSGGRADDDGGKPKDNKISLTQAEALRSKNYKEYIRYLKAGRIANE